MVNTWQIIIIKNCKLENVDLKNILLLKINRTLIFQKLGTKYSTTWTRIRSQTQLKKFWLKERQVSLNAHTATQSEPPTLHRYILYLFSQLLLFTTQRVNYDDSFEAQPPTALFHSTYWTLNSNQKPLDLFFISNAVVNFTDSLEQFGI